MNEKLVTVQINGKKEFVESDESIKGLLSKKGINFHVVACELNLKIIRREHLNETKLKDGDTLEIIQMMGGG